MYEHLILFLDDNRHCKCRDSYPESLKYVMADGEPVGKSCTNRFSENGEPWCWIKSSIRHTCTDAKRDNSQNQRFDSISNWYYSTRPCASKTV